MEAIIKFNLPEDEEDFQVAVNGKKMYSVLREMDQWLRSNTKYAPDSMSEDTYNAYQKSRDQLHEFMNDVNISIN